MLRLALVFSGAASLMYQVVWTRRLITVTSATATAQAIVLAVFMAGLGLGAWLAGRQSVRLRRPARAYVAVELAAALLALASLPVISASEGLRATALRAGAGGASSWIQLAVLAAFLLAPTTLLGASLPLLIEHAERTASPERRGRSIATFYGLNTVGACGGCLFAGFVTVERVGLVRTAALGAGCAVVAAVIAWIASRGAAERANESETVVATEARHALVPRANHLSIAAALAGFVGVGAEIVWTRLFALILPNTVYTFTQVLVAVLLGISIGAFAAGAVTRRMSGTSRILPVAGALVAVAAVLLGTIPWLVVRFADSAALQKSIASGRSLGSAALVLGCLVPVSALLAAVLPLLVLARSEGRPARTFGALYGVNILGSVAGSLAAGFVLIPIVGVKGAGAALVVATLALAALLLPRSSRAITILVAGGASSILHFAHDIPREIYQRHLDPSVTIREVREGVSSHVMVTDDPKRGNERRLWINSFWVAGSTGPHRVFGLLPGLFNADPKRVLGIALGTGQTFAAALRHGATELDCVEIDPGVVELARRWFADVNGDLLHDPRVRVHVEDGRTFMRAATTRYDLIVLEPLQAWSAGTSNLYSREFYEEAKRILAPGGVIAQWIPFYGQGPEETRAMVSTGASVFPQSSLWLVAKDGVMLLSDAPFELRLDAIDQRLQERGLAADFATLSARGAADLLPYLLLGPTGIARWVEGAPVLVDDRPFLEFRAASQIGTTETRFRDIVRSALPAVDDVEPYLVEATLTDDQKKAIDAGRRAKFRALAELH